MSLYHYIHKLCIQLETEEVCLDSDGEEDEERPAHRGHPSNNPPSLKPMAAAVDPIHKKKMMAQLYNSQE